jgi:hypothetical protein
MVKSSVWVDVYGSEQLQIAAIKLKFILPYIE